MTLNDIFTGIINYDLNELGKNFLSPFGKGIYYGVVGIFLVLVVISGILVLLELYQLITKKFTSKKTSETSQPHTGIKIDKNDWERVGNREGLYCYYCTKKLHLESWKNIKNYYCDECYEKLSNWDTN